MCLTGAGCVGRARRDTQRCLRGVSGGAGGGRDVIGAGVSDGGVVCWQGAAGHPALPAGRERGGGGWGV